MSRHNQRASRIGGVIAGDRVLARETRLQKRWWSITPERAADLLADLVFVMLILLLFVWVRLWTLVH